ncbi:MAG: DUF1844 domain-containing protein [Phycisphaerales bacterium]
MRGPTAYAADGAGTTRAYDEPNPRDADMPDAPKIIVDTDWKAQAQAEKEKLTAAEKPAARSAAPAPTAGAPAGQGPGGETIEASVDELIRLLATQALMYLGAFPDPETGRAVVALDYAKLHIDLLGILEQKTKGNLTEQEGTMLTRALHELRMQYVEVAKAVAKAVQEGRVSKSGPGGVPTIDPQRPQVH